MEQTLHTFNKLSIINLNDFNRSKFQMQLIKAFRACNDPENLAIIYERYLDSSTENDRADVRFLEFSTKSQDVISEMGDIYRRNKYTSGGSAHTNKL
jgi:hypothetical protein